jgi:hypothetical protein
MLCDRLSTMVSSCELFFGAVGAVEGRTTMVAFFGLSSSLEENHSSSRTGEYQNKEIVGHDSQITYESSNSNIVGIESLEVVCSCSKSFGLDVPEEVKSSMHFRFFSTP